MNRSYFSKLPKFLCLAFFIATACEREEERLTAADSKDVSEETVVDSYYQDMDDMAAISVEAPTDDEFSGGRVSGEIVIEDHRFCEGTVVTITPGNTSTIENPNGLITIDFGTSGCTDSKGNVRKGKILLAYTGRRFVPGSVVVITPENYSINGILVEGTRTSTNVTASLNDPPKFHVVLQNGKATFPDNTVAMRQSDIYWSWVRAASPLNDKVIIHSNSVASGTTRAGRTYEVTLQKQLEYSRFCAIAISGVKTYLIDGEREVVIDFGNGDCDQEITISFNGNTYNVRIA